VIRSALQQLGDIDFERNVSVSLPKRAWDFTQRQKRARDSVPATLMEAWSNRQMEARENRMAEPKFQKSRENKK
jgi:hypothetical protein